MLDGDDFSGERCELGENDWRDGPTAFYREGEHRMTYVSYGWPTTIRSPTPTGRS